MSLISSKVKRSPKLFSELIMGDIVYVYKIKDGKRIYEKRIIDETNKSLIQKNVWVIRFKNSPYGVDVYSDKSVQRFGNTNNVITYSTYEFDKW